MKWPKSLSIIMVVLLLSACNSNVQIVNNEEQSVNLEGKHSSPKVTPEEVETTLTEIPIQVGAHPRCCLGIKILKAEMQTNPDLLILQLELRTLLGYEDEIKDTNLYIGYEDRIPAINLLTEQGIYEGYIHENVLLVEGEPKTVKIIFADVKGKPLGLSVRRVFEESQVQDGSYKEADRQGYFAYLEDVNEKMMKRIGQQLFNKVTSIELANTEIEAIEIMETLFNQDYPPEIANILLGEITYGEYDDFDINYLDESVELKDKGAFIEYHANVEINFYDKNGTVDRIKGFGVRSLISISPATGNYIYSALDFDYLTGMDSYWDVGE